MYYDLSTVYQDTLIIIETNKGLVYSIPTNLTGGWKKIAEVGYLPRRQVFPAPVLKESDYEIYSVGSFYDEFIDDTAPPPPKKGEYLRV